MNMSSFPRLAGRRAALTSALALTLMSGFAATAATPFNPVFDLQRGMQASALSGVVMPSIADGLANYTIVFKEAPLATYDGELAAYRAPGKRVINGVTTSKLDVNSVAARSYVSYLDSKQNAFVGEVSSQFSRPVKVIASMQHALNAVILELDAHEVSAIRKRDDVWLIEREHELELHTDRGPTFIGAPSIWNGATASGADTKGEGIVVGVIDTGINWESPAFAAVDPTDGYVHQNPRGTGNYLGLCQTGFADVGRCNDKLIGIYNFASTAPTRTGTDTQGHGSHTASTVAGNSWTATYASGQFNVSGVAPRANVIAYLACPSTCPTTATTQSVNQAVIDGVDVISYSISGGASPWTDTTSVAFRNAVAAGAFVAASAGNTSTDVPNPQGQVNHLEPWVETVAASTHDRVIAVSFKLTSESNPPANTQDVPMRPGALPLPTESLSNVPLIKSPNFANGLTDGCSAYPADTFSRPYVAPEVPADRIFADDFDPNVEPPKRVGGIAVLNLDSTASACGSGARRTAALNAGAVGVIFVDVAYLNLGAASTSWSMLRSDWDNIEAAYTAATATASVDINARGYAGEPDVVAGFSFRGPRLVGGQGIVKPDITGPGVDILAVGASNAVGANGVYLNNGTSMSAPHLAGAAALMRALNPTWSPTQIKSALNLSSNNFGAINQDGTPIRIWDYGSGRVNLSAASKVGLIMDETAANFVAANPAAGGDISTLNLASFAKYNAIGDVAFTRTFRRARAGSQTYDLAVTGLPAGAATLSASSFSINSAGTRSITLTVKSGLLPEGQWALGELTLTPTSGDEPTLHLPIAVYPGGPTIAVNPTSIAASSDTTVSSNLTISNTANPTLNWEVMASGTANMTPFSTTSTSNGWQGGTYLGFNPARGYHWSQNFDITASTRITTLRANGFTLPSTATLTAANTTGVTFSIYADNGGEPAGAPQGFGNPPLWTFTGAINAANGITTTGGAITLNLNAANVVGTPLNLNPGRYWMTVSPSINGTGAQTAANPLWAWFVSGDVPIGNVPKLYAPWSDPTQFTTGDGLMMLSGLIQGEVGCALPSWASLTTTSGSLGYQASQTIPVTFNASGLAAGTYTGTLCISSNATNRPIEAVPLSFTVPTGGAVLPTLAKSFTPSSVETAVDSLLTITLGNAGGTAATLTSSLTDSLPSGLVVAPTPAAATTCTGGSVTASSGATSVVLSSGAEIPAAGSCTVTVNVRATNAGSYENTIAEGELQTSSGNNAAPASATLTVTESTDPIVCSAPLNHSVAPTSNGTSINWISGDIVDSDPASGYDLNLWNSSLQVWWSNAPTINAGVAPSSASANLRVLGFSTLVGPASIWSRTNGAMTDWRAGQNGFLGFRFDCSSLETSPSGTCYGYMHMTTTGASGHPAMIIDYCYDKTGAPITTPGFFPGPPTVSKVFAPPVTTTDSSSTLTITLRNNNAAPATLTSALTDTLPSGLVVATPANASTTCGGTVTAAPGANSVVLDAGSTLPAGSSCTVSVSVKSEIPGLYTNTIAVDALQTSNGNNVASASASLVVSQPDGTSLVCSPPINKVISSSAIGGSINWNTGDTCDCDTDNSYDFNVYESGSTAAFYWNSNAAGGGGVATAASGGSYRVLGTGDVIGSSSIFSAAATAAYAASWRNAAGVDGYLGFKFKNRLTGQINYGYAHLQTTGTTGFPVTIVDYCYDQAGASVTIPAPVVTHTVTPSVDGGNGAISPSSPVTINDGATTNFTLTPDSGYVIDSVDGTCGGSLADDVFTTDPVTADCTVIAIFAPAVQQCASGSPVEVFASAGTPGPSGYTSLKLAFDAVNAGTHQGEIDIDICGDSTETASAAINASGSGGASYSALTIKPAGGGARTISGAIAAASPLIDLAGASNVTIDGLDSDGNSLTLANTTVSGSAGTSTIRFINGASNNTLTRTTVLGSSTTAAGTAGGTILFSTSTVAGGNSNNTVSNNRIGPAGSNLPTKGLMSLGTTANRNVGNVIDGNFIFDFFNPTVAPAGIVIQANNNNWTISNNRIYQTAPRTFTGAAGIRYSGILFNSANNTSSLTGNVIGFGAPDGTGVTTITGTGTGLGNEVRGIVLTNSNTDLGSFSTIQGNTISGINQTTNRASTTAEFSAFIGIHSGSSSDAPANIIGNTIGSLDGSSEIVVNHASTTASTASITGILDYNWVNDVTVADNEIGSIKIQGAGTTVGFRGIIVSSTTGLLHSITGNTIGGTASGSISNSLVGSYAMYAIQVGNASATVQNNTVRNMFGNSNGGIVVMSGISMSGSTNANASTVSNNTIHSLHNKVLGGASGAIYALDLALPVNAANLVERNSIHSIWIDTTFLDYQLRGIVMRGQGSATFQNNMVRLGFNAAGDSIVTPYQIVGINELAGATSNFYFNSVYIGGSNVDAGGSNTFAFSSSAVTVPRNIQNNIFWNARGNATPGGLVHLAVSVGGTTVNPAGLKSNHNIIYASGVDGFTGLYNTQLVQTLADWRTATGQDLNSVAADPKFVAPNGSAAIGDLHIQLGTPTPVEGAGTVIVSVTNDFDGDLRADLSPVDIGADAGDFTP
jgi:hypothetical protein